VTTLLCIVVGALMAIPVCIGIVRSYRENR
jgi:hypothetical protein